MAGTYDGTTMRLYVDGVLASAESRPQGIAVDDSEVVIGTRLSLPSSTFQGRIDEVEIFDRALSQVEIQAIVDAGPSGKCKALEAAVDIRPFSDTHPVNPMSRGVVPVAILGSDTLDVADIDRTTLAFGPAAAATVFARGGLVRDLNGDDVPDLVSLYRIQDTGIAFGDTEACVTGELLDGRPFEGCDAIETISGCGRGAELALLLPLLVGLRRRARRA